MICAAITVNTRLHDSQPYDYLPQAYVPFLETLGVRPVLIPTSHPDPVNYARALGAEALVLSGGGDIDPAVYGAPNTGSENIVARRDGIEKQLLDLALAQQWPVLGICRGFQMINVYFGGSLVQDIPSQIAADPAAPIAHRGALHPVALRPGPIREALGADRLAVNSDHHQGVTAERLAPDLEAFAVSEADGIIEGVWHRAHPVLAVQWHPERRDYPAAAGDSVLFRRIFERGWWR